MPQLYNPLDWYWRRRSASEVFSSARQAFVPLNDAAFAAWGLDGNGPTPWPRDATGAESDAEMQTVLSAIGLSLPGHLAVPASVSSAQAKIALLRAPAVKGGKSLLDDVKAAVAADATGEIAIWFSDAGVWERSSSYVASLASALGLASGDVDALFAAAGEIAA